MKVHPSLHLLSACRLRRHRHGLSCNPLPISLPPHAGAVSSAMESAKETARGVKEAAAGAGVGAGAGDEASRATGGGGGGILDSVKDAAAVRKGHG